MRRWWIPVLVGLVALVVVSSGKSGDGPPLDPDGTGELGTKALVLLLEEFGAAVDVTSRADEHDVALLLSDRLDPVDRARLADWVDDGGTLVVADPSSPLGAGPAGTDFFGGLFDATISAGDCDVTALASLDRVDPGGGLPLTVLPGDQACFGDREGAFVVVSERRQGRVVSIGGAAAFTNALLGAEDNAALAVSLLAPRPGTSVAFLEPPLPGSGERGLVDLVSDGVKLGLLQLAVAFLVYALWRAIRVGRPVVEQQPVDVDSSEFVAAVGNLLAERRHPAASAAIVADDASSRVAAIVGLGPGADRDAIARAVASRTARSAEEVERLLVPDAVSSDDELVAFVHRLDRLTEELHRGQPAAD